MKHQGPPMPVESFVNSPMHRDKSKDHIVGHAVYQNPIFMKHQLSSDFFNDPYNYYHSNQ